MQDPMTVFGTWQIVRPIGTGTYGKTYEILNFTQEKGVYKIMKIPVELKRNTGEFPVKTQETAYKELKNDILSSVRYIQLHDNGRFFVNYQDCSFVPSEDYKTMTVSLRMEQLTSLASISEVHDMTQSEVLRLAVNVCRCLEKCREMDYVYPNLKPNNIFITKSGCKLGDFGTFGMYEPSKINVAMRKTQDYMAPELIKFGEINSTSDTYSLGLIMYALLNRNKLPFIPRYEENVSMNDMQTAIDKRCANYIFPDPDNASDDIKKIIAKACSCVVGNRYKTPTQMKNDLLAALGERKEDNPFEPAIPEMPKITNETEKPAQKQESNGVHKVGNIAMYEYETKKKHNIVLDKKKKILLLAIAVVLVLLIVVVAVIVSQDSETASAAGGAIPAVISCISRGIADYGR